MGERRWASLTEMRAAYAASGLELAKRHPQCRGKIRYGTWEDAQRHCAELAGSRDEHRRRAQRLNVYHCRWCGGYHVGHRPLAPGRHGQGRTTRH